MAIPKRNVLSLLMRIHRKGREILTAIEPERGRGDAYDAVAVILHTLVEEAEQGTVLFYTADTQLEGLTSRLKDMVGVLIHDPQFGEVRALRVDGGRSVGAMLQTLRTATVQAGRAVVKEQASVVTPEIPEQETPAPFEFSVEERLDVVEQPPRPLLSPSDISAARQFLLDSAQRQLDALSNSPQVQSELRILVERLKADGNVVALGMAAEAFSRVVKASEEELGGARAGALLGLAEEVERFASQFEEWQQYVENAARTRYGQDDIAQAVGALQELARTLDGTLASAKAIDALKEASEFDTATAKGKAGIVNTLKNFVVAVSKRVAEIVANKALEGAVLTLAGFAVSALATPVLQALPWVAPLFEYLKALVM